MSDRRIRDGFIAQAWLVIVLSLFYGSALAVVHTVLGEKIAANKKKETYRVIPDLVPGADQERTEEMLVRGGDGKNALIYRARGGDGTPVGWVLPAGGQGFADRIELLVGLSADLTKITGMYVLDQKETPGLGDYIKGESFRSRFEGKPADRPLVIVKGEPQADHEVRALTGATISSESVSGIVNTTLANLRGPLEQAVRAGGASEGGSGT